MPGIVRPCVEMQSVGPPPAILPTVHFEDINIRQERQREDSPCDARIGDELDVRDVRLTTVIVHTAGHAAVGQVLSDLVGTVHQTSAWITQPGYRIRKMLATIEGVPPQQG